MHYRCLVLLGPVVFNCARMVVVELARLSLRGAEGQKKEGQSSPSSNQFTPANQQITRIEFLKFLSHLMYVRRTIDTA